MNTLDKKYQDLLQDILDNGVHKSDRTGTGTISVFGRQIRHNMKQGFPILTTKKVAWKGVVSELLWFLTGQTNISFLLKHNNHIWDGDVYKNYAAKTSMDVDGQYTKEQFIEKIQTDKDFAKKWGDLGPIYGKQWRKWKGDTWVEGNTDGTEGFYLQSQYVDQIDNLINELKTNPDSRRLMVSAWNVGELDQMTLPPCHYGFQIYTREENGQRYISLMWNQRSVDTFLGLPFNIASYGLLLHIIANEVGMIPDELIGNLGDTHLYSNHIEQAKEQLSRTPYDLPTLKTQVKIDGICCATPDDFILEGYQHHPTIKAPLSN
jgi:thymidylate synthase